MGNVLNSPDQAWCDDLLLRLRLRDVPGARIGEVLAEVQSHVAETGESPREAFGTPRGYADQIAAALGMRHVRGPAALLRGLSFRDLLQAALTGVACFVLAQGLWSLGARERSIGGLPAWAVCSLAAAVLIACIARFAVAARHDPGDPVIDPRTGADVTPFGGWRLVVLAVLPLLALAGMLLGGLLSRS